MRTSPALAALLAYAVLAIVVVAPHGSTIAANQATTESTSDPALMDAGAVPIPAEPGWFVPDEIVVVFDEPTTAQIEAAQQKPLEPGQIAVIGDEDLDDVARVFNVTGMRKEFPGSNAQAAARRGLPDLSGYFVLKFDSSAATADEVIAAYLATPGVVHAEKIGVHAVLATPNDVYYANQWHLNQASDKDMDAPEAWNIETGDTGVIVAVLDTGVRYFHKDLGGSNASYSNPTAADGNMWINWAEKNGTPGVDDDGNGYVDDWIGWDFVTGVTGCWSGEDCTTADNDPRDFNGHGTHCAGNVAAINNNGFATAAPSGGWGNGTLQPTANGVKVMALRIGWSGNYGGSEVGYVRMDFAASAFYYAANNGARIASCSWSSSSSGGISAAVSYFVASGGMIFKAAGNDGTQTADYLCGRSDVYSVAATDRYDHKASFSTYGTWVDISAPGVSIYSLYHGHSSPTTDYVASMSGTSMATPLAASGAALVWSHNPGWSAAQVWAQLRDTADSIDALNPSYAGKLGSGRVNLFNAVNTTSGCAGPADCDDGDPCNGLEQCVAGDCQPGPLTADCNGNDLEDACDIAAGRSQDCDGNGVPDECDIAAGAVPDCNNNGIPDSCDIASGFSADQNGNGVPDECENASTLLMAFTSATAVPGVGTVQDEDIVAYDTGTGTWSLYFDGSDVGLSGFAIRGLAVLPNGHLLISVDVSGSLAGLTGGPSGTSITPSDIVEFVPTSLGPNTSGSWAFYFDGSDVGLTRSSEYIDALGVTSDGGLIISTRGNPSVSGVSGLSSADLIKFTPTSLGAITNGTWSYYFDASDVGLTSSSENVDGVAIASSGSLLLSTTGNFSVPGVSGANEDVLKFTPTSLGSTTSGSYAMFLDLSALGIASGADIGALEILD